jgi:hypothetical protein
VALPARLALLRVARASEPNFELAALALRNNTEFIISTGGGEAGAGLAGGRGLRQGIGCAGVVEGRVRWHRIVGTGGAPPATCERNGMYVIGL